MESHEVMRQVLEETPAKLIAAELGVSLSLVYKWSQRDLDGGTVSNNPLDRVHRLFEITRHEMIVQWLCRKAGGVFVKNPRTPANPGLDVMPVTQAIVQQFADLLAAIGHAAADNMITEAEAKKIRHEWDELKRFTEGFVKWCEQGDFVKLNEDLNRVHLQ